MCGQSNRWVSARVIIMLKKHESRWSDWVSNQKA